MKLEFTKTGGYIHFELESGTTYIYAKWNSKSIIWRLIKHILQIICVSAILYLARHVAVEELKKMQLK